MKHQPKEYLAIRLWGRNFGSYEYYIVGEQEKAAEDGAPLDALYERDGTWHCVSGMHSEHPFRAQYEAYLKENGQ